MNADRATGVGGGTPANGDSSLFDGTSNLIPRTMWDGVPLNATPYPPLECDQLQGNVAAVLRKAQPLLVDQWAIEGPDTGKALN